MELVLQFTLSRVTPRSTAQTTNGRMRRVSGLTTICNLCPFFGSTCSVKAKSPFAANWDTKRSKTLAVGRHTTPFSIAKQSIEGIPGNAPRLLLRCQHLAVPPSLLPSGFLWSPHPARYRTAHTFREEPHHHG
eukprot:9468313-Pyramimonas_sp.AAC.1